MDRIVKVEPINLLRRVALVFKLSIAFGTLRVHKGILMLRQLIILKRDR